MADSPSVPPSPFTKIDAEVATWRRKHAQTRLAADCRSLARRLEHIANQCDRDEPALLNSLGELQGQATMIDAACGALSVWREVEEGLRG